MSEKSIASAIMPRVGDSDGPEEAFMGPPITLVPEEPDGLLQQKVLRNR